MANRKLIRYAVALERIQEVAKEENWGIGSPLFYLAELEDDKDRYAKERSGLNYSGFEGYARGCAFAIAGGVGGSVLGATLMNLGADSGLVAKTFSGAVGGFFGGAILTGLVTFGKCLSNGIAIENIRQEYNKRKIARGSKVSEEQKRSAYKGLIRSENSRFDIMTKGKYPISEEGKKELNIK